MKFKSLAVLTAAMMLTACAANSENHAGEPVSSRDTSLGSVMTSKQGMTLYTFTKDAAGVSNCNGGCAENWPPFMAGPSAHDTGKFTIITRADGSKQWAYESKPLYFWVGDRAPGDVTGHGVKDVWFTVKMDSAKSHKQSNYNSSSYY
ncbi:uncharacterized protein conserved in bacteria [Hahella chejuensis KCTC 2396]|uniref:Uncharacterized protein conserved in bacteria n=1 Tax=Hahella chejuensis (strain KCTC 2396) TaxID=349521 RepID=Q2SEQ9_HAHCH|nr:hypothetical protein [Hahella chejuensis]ABC30865.1 uncharacterized protein conserved in bacteria [Hahella chejuensis KCTC 2396]